VPDVQLAILTCPLLSKMSLLDALSLTLSILGIYSLILALRYLIPCYTVPYLWARLNEAQQLLGHAEAINAIPPESEHRTHLERYEDLYFDSLTVDSYTDLVVRTTLRRCACRAITPEGPFNNCALLSNVA
jgi:hypothetical protein